MKNKYYDKWIFDQAVSLIDINPIEANLQFEQYINNYPSDYPACLYYALNLIQLNELDKAQQVLDYINKTFRQDKKFMRCSSDKVAKFKKELTIAIAKLLAYKENYNELNELIKSKNTQLGCDILDMTGFYCRKKLGLLSEDRREIHNYSFRQIVDYREDDFLEHVKKHISGYDNSVEKTQKSIFVENFPFNRMLVEIKKYIPSDKKICRGFISDLYVFKCIGCGKDEGRMTDYFVVTTFHNTQDIITIYPTNDFQYYPYYDLNYLLENQNFSKSREISRIDKFNKKYNRKK